MRTKRATATINKEVDITVGSDLFIVGFKITASIDVGSWGIPVKPPSVDEWVDLQLEYVQCVMVKFSTVDSLLQVFKKHILELAELAGIKWVYEYDETKDTKIIF